MRRKEHPRVGGEREAPTGVDPDLFLDEEKLIALAIRELHGKRPFSKRENSSALLTDAMRNVELRQALQQKTLLQRELESRAWTTRDLSKLLGISESESVALASGRARISAKLAEKLASIFATSVEFWL